MCGQMVHGLVGFTLDGRLEHGLVFVQFVALRIAGGHGKLPVTVGLVVELAAEALQLARSGRADQRHVEGPVAHLPFRIGRIGPFVR